MVNEVLSYLRPKDGGIYVDCTLGSGGHTMALLDCGKDIMVYGIDRDHEAIANAKLKIQNAKLKLICGNFAELGELVKEQVDGILFDLGVSSEQLDTPERGFSHRLSGPLDMRMDRSSGIPCFKLLEKMGRDDLEFILKTYGEESRGKKLATEILKTKPKTTDELADIVRRVTPYKGRARVLSRVFQALRIFVNNELPAIEDGLKSAVKILKNRGRVCVISYHSLEDRIVKQFFKSSTELRILTKHPIRPSEDEVLRNRRARSAKLRCAEKIGL